MMTPRDLPLLAVFTAVARHGSFTAAARELGVAKSVVSEQVRQLEERLDARLLERTTRHLKLTELGTQVLDSAELVERELRALSARLEEHRHVPRGTLRIATTQDLGHRLVAPVAATLSARYPELHFDISADDSPRDLLEGGFDVAVRLGALRDSSMIARRLLDIVEPIVAAPELATRFAHATRPQELRGAPWVRHTVVAAERLTFLGPREQRDEITISVRAQANSGDSVRSLALGGAGLAVLPYYLVGEDLAEGRLVRLCPEWIWKRVTLYALLPSTKHRRRSVEVFVSELKERLASSRARWG